MINKARSIISNIYIYIYIYIYMCVCVCVCVYFVTSSYESDDYNFRVFSKLHS